MQLLVERYRKKLAQTDTRFVRSLMQDINWDARLIAVRGARGVGKTTLLLQRILLSEADRGMSLYVSLDNIWFSENKLIDLVDDFVKKGGEYLYLDEVHKYESWSQEIKNIYDDYPELHIVFTGSSLLEMLNERADLSRRAVSYKMQGLSYREFLEMKYQHQFAVVDFSDIANNHVDISSEITAKIRPLKYFIEYLQSGYYPFFIEDEKMYHIRLEEVINMILEVELPQLRNVNISYVGKLKQLLQVISESAPFIPNILKLSERLNINRETLLAYLNFMSEANLISSVFKEGKGISVLQKPDKIFVNNTNLMYALRGELMDIGNARETFFLNQVSYKNTVNIADKADFVVDGKLTFEVGGKNKSIKQVAGLPEGFVAVDDIEIGDNNKIPLWLFGFLY